MIECLKYSPLTIALSRMESVPLSLLSKAYSSSNYIKEEKRITFEFHNRKTSITKSQFCSLLQIPQSDDMINPESVKNVVLLEIFYQMDYKETLTAISMFWKPNLPPQWNGLFTLLFKGFSEGWLDRTVLASFSWLFFMVSTHVRTLTMAPFYGLKLFRALSPLHIKVKSLVHAFGLSSSTVPLRSSRSRWCKTFLWLLFLIFTLLG